MKTPLSLAMLLTLLTICATARGADCYPDEPINPMPACDDQDAECRWLRIQFNAVQAGQAMLLKNTPDTTGFFRDNPLNQCGVKGLIMLEHCGKFVGRVPCPSIP